MVLVATERVGLASGFSRTTSEVAPEESEVLLGGEKPA